MAMTVVGIERAQCAFMLHTSNNGDTETAAIQPDSSDTLTFSSAVRETARANGRALAHRPRRLPLVQLAAPGTVSAPHQAH